MTTTVTDAGTDSKIAKVIHYRSFGPSMTDIASLAQFHKRSVDIVGLGTLEATEVWAKSREDIIKRARK